LDVIRAIYSLSDPANGHGAQFTTTSSLNKPISASFCSIAEFHYAEKA
jgi:hypothetical protein